MTELDFAEICVQSVFSPNQCKGIFGGWSLGGTRNHIKVTGPAPFPHQRKISTDGILGQYPVSMLVKYCTQGMLIESVITKLLRWGKHAFNLCVSLHQETEGWYHVKHRSLGVVPQTTSKETHISRVLPWLYTCGHFCKCTCACIHFTHKFVWMM